MGYNVHITRAKRWPDSERHPITSEEWLATIARDPELRIAPNQGKYFAFWNVRDSEEWGAWLDWRRGKIYAKNPDEALIRKMAEIAQRLRAAVQGDDEEYYSADGTSSYHVPESVAERLANFLRRAGAELYLFPRRLWALVFPAPCDFYVGQKVLDHLGREAVVIEVNRRSPAGTAVVSIRYANGMQVHHVGRSAMELKAFPDGRPN